MQTKQISDCLGRRAERIYNRVPGNFVEQMGVSDLDVGISFMGVDI